MIRNQTELNRIPCDKDDIRIAQFPISKQRSLKLNQQYYVKNLTIGINALNGVSLLELNGLRALERLVIMQGGLIGGSGRLRVMNCSNLISIDIGEMAFTKFKYLELIDLPLLQIIKMKNNVFRKVYTIQMESNEREIL